MNKELAGFLVDLIAREYDSKRKEGMDMSSYECELLEQRFMEGKFDEIDKYLRKKFENIYKSENVESEIGDFIENPEEYWFDILEVKILRFEELISIRAFGSDRDFISLKEISDKYPNECLTVIAESPLKGEIYRYNNYGDKEWQLVGKMIGYA